MFDKDYMFLNEDILTEDKNGTALNRLWMSNQEVEARLVVTGTISGTSPTLDVKIQGSNDNGSNWTDIVSFTQVTTAAASEYKRFLAPFKQLRAVADVGGTSPSYGKVQCGLVPAGMYNTPA